MNDLLGVTAEEFLQSLKRRKAALPSEIGTFIALEVCEVLCQRGPAQVGLADVRISLEGEVSVFAAGGAIEEEQGARAVHKLLTDMLLASGPSLTPGLLRVVEETPPDGEWRLPEMRDNLEAALVPLNRKAARRVLSRLLREMERGGGPSSRPQQGLSFDQLDQELGALLGEDPQAAPPPQAAAAEPDRSGDAASSRGLEPVERDPGPDVHRAQAVEPAREGGEDPRPGGLATDDSGNNIAHLSGPDPSSGPDLPNSQQRTLVKDPDEMFEDIQASAPTGLRGFESINPSQRPPPSKGLWVGLGLVVLTIVLAGGIFIARPDVLARLRGEAPAPKETTPIELPAAPVAGDLVVKVSPERSQVLRFVGRGPVTVKNLPLGVAHELVAVADAVAPSRVVIPADAQWEQTPDGPRYEVAVQTGAKVKESRSLELGDSSLPQDVGKPSSKLGDVRVVTTPRGAKVYQLIGFAPEVRAQNLPVDEVLELLIYHPGRKPMVKVLSPSDWQGAGPKKSATLDITLER